MLKYRYQPVLVLDTVTEAPIRNKAVTFHTETGSGAQAYDINGTPIGLRTNGHGVVTDFWADIPRGRIRADAVDVGVWSPDGFTTITGDEGGATVLNHTVTTDNEAITLPTAMPDTVVTVILTQDSTGGHPVTWPADVVWDTGIAPTPTGVPGGRDVFAFLRTGTDWLGFTSGTFEAGPDVFAPSAPTGLTAEPSGSSVQLSWLPSADNVAVAGYEYRINGGTPVSAGSATTAVVSGLTPSTAYVFEVRAFDTAGNRSAWSTSVTATAATAWAGAVTDLAPSAWWRLGDTGTPVVDHSGNARNGYFSGPVTKGQASLVPSDTTNGSMLLPGADNAAAYVDHATWMGGGTQPFTIAFTMKKNGNPATEQQLMSRLGTDTSLRHWNCSVTPTGFVKFSYFAATVSHAEITGDIPVCDNAAHLVVATYDYDGANYRTRIYVDGVLDVTGTSATAATASPVANIGIGIRPDTFGNDYAGYLDEALYFVGTALTGTQVTALHNAWLGA